MWPWGHAIAGYAVVTAASLVYHCKPLSTKEAIVVIVGTQIPDLVDKPLSWTFNLLPAARSLAHSLLVFVIVASLGVIFARKYSKLQLVLPLVGGYLIGILTDVPLSAIAGDWSRASFLLWPVMQSPTYSTEPSFIAHFEQLEAAHLSRVLLIGTILVLGHLVLMYRPWKKLSRTGKSS